MTTNPKVERQLQAFFQHHRGKSVAMSEGNMGYLQRGWRGRPSGRGRPHLFVLEGKARSN